MRCRGLNRAIIETLREWRSGEAYSYELAPVVSLKVGRRVSAKTVGHRLTLMQSGNMVTRRPGRHAYIWSIAEDLEK